MADTNVVEKDLGPVSAYAIAVKHGYKGTEEEWAALQIASAENAKAADASAKEAAKTLAAVHETVEQETTAAVVAVNNQETASIQAVKDAAQDAAAYQEERIAVKGEQTLASIPDDYTKLGQDVAALTEEIDNSFEFEAKGKNLYNGVSAPGYLLKDGTLAQYSDWHTTDFINVHGLDSVVASAARLTDLGREAISLFFLTVYDEGKNVINHTPGYASTTYAPTENVYYIRFSYHSNTHEKVMVEVGATHSASYEPYMGVRLVKDSDYLRSGKKNVKYSDLSDSFAGAFVGDYEAMRLEFSVKNELLNLATGTFESFAGINHTDYIECDEIESLKLSGKSYLAACILAFFDADKKMMVAYPNKGGTIPYADEMIVPPKKAKYMVVVDTSGVQGVATTLKQLTRWIASSVEPWGKKKWVCVGDSLTERNSRTTKSYHDYVAEATGIEVVNMGQSGTGYARTQDSGHAFYQRIVNVPTDADVVTIFGSGNDLGAGLPLGNPTDTGTETLCGCINTTIDNLIAIMPAVSLGIVSPTPWVGSEPSNPACGMALYCDALKTICEYRSIPFLDLYHCSNLRPWTEEGRAACYSKDDGNGVHPDETGHALIAPRFKAFLEALIM